jgi:hypothetical protein
LRSYQLCFEKECVFGGGICSSSACPGFGVKMTVMKILFVSMLCIEFCAMFYREYDSLDASMACYKTFIACCMARKRYDFIGQNFQDNHTATTWYRALRKSRDMGRTSPFFKLRIGKANLHRSKLLLRIARGFSIHKVVSEYVRGDTEYGNLASLVSAGLYLSNLSVYPCATALIRG